VSGNASCAKISPTGIEPVKYISTIRGLRYYKEGESWSDRDQLTEIVELSKPDSGSRPKICKEEMLCQALKAVPSEVDTDRVAQVDEPLSARQVASIPESVNRQRHLSEKETDRRE